MGGCCSKFGSYLPRKEDGNLSKNGGGTTPKITKLEKKQSFVAASEKEPVRNNGDVAVHENGDATVSASATANGKTVESKVEDKRKKSTSSSSSSDDGGKNTNEDIVITHMDGGGGGGVTVSTGIAPVDLQPNVNVTPVHSQSSTSYSTAAPDANTTVEEVVITKSSVLNEPGHTKVIEETKKTTYITSTSIINEEIHFVEDSGKPVAIDENVSTVKKTVVEVKGAEVAVEHKAVSRSSSSSSSSSEDDASNKQDAKENEVVMKNESEKEEMPDESKDNIEVVVDNLSCEKGEEIDQQISPEIENAPTIIIEEPLETKEEIAKEETAEEIEAKRKASLIQAEVKVVSEAANLQEDEENNSSSSSSSSSDNEEDESTTKNQEQVEEMVVPSVSVADEDSLVLECPSNFEAEELQPKVIDEKPNEPEIVETVVQPEEPPVSSSSSEDEHEQEVDEIIVKDTVEPEVECEAPETVSTKNDEDFSPPSPSADEDDKGEPPVSSSSSEDEHEQEVDEIIVKDNVEPEVGYEAPETVSTKNDEALPPPSPSADENDTGEENVVVEDITKSDEVSEETVITTTKHEGSSSSSSSSSSSEDENDNEEKNITPTYVNVQDAIHVEPETSSTKSDDKTQSHEDENEIEAEEEIHENNAEADTEHKEPEPVSEEIVDPPTTSYDKYTSLVTPSGFSAPVLTSQQQSDADYSSVTEPSDNPVADGVDAAE